MGIRKTTAFFISLLLLSSSLICSCATGKKIDPADPAITWGFRDKAIEIFYRADKNLNQYDNKPHTILMCVFQLSDPNVFSELSTSVDGLNKLLQCSRFDASVAGFRRIIVQPGDVKQIVLDRAEGAKWLGIAAGYYNMNPDFVTRLFEIPIMKERKMLIFTKPVPGKLSINLVLGPDKIHQTGSNQ
jgi:predicted component of type VI protein secretion system